MAIRDEQREAVKHWESFDRLSSATSVQRKNAFTTSTSKQYRHIFSHIRENLNAIGYVDVDSVQIILYLCE